MMNYFCELCDWLCGTDTNTTSTRFLSCVEHFNQIVISQSVRHHPDLQELSSYHLVIWQRCATMRSTGAIRMYGINKYDILYALRYYQNA